MANDREHPSGGGLVVQDGPGAGTSFPLHYPVTLVGRSGGCDVRLEAGSVRPLHCLLTPGPNSVSLRAVAAGGVRVNGRPATTASLRDGDVVEVGPCRLRLRWPAVEVADDPILESLRIQAAAVVAQQTALADLEARLDDRAASLSRQESQVAAHLEDQRRQLLELQDQITQARQSLREKRATFAALSAEQEGELACVRRETEARRADVERRETRLHRLWGKFRQRMRSQTEQARRADEAATAQRGREQELFEAEHERFEEFRRGFHTAAELEKRQIADEWDRVRAAEAEDRELRVRLNLQARELARREKAVAAAERSVAAERARVWCDRNAHRQEAERLEARAANAAAALAARKRDLEAFDGLFAPRAVETAEPPIPLDRLAGDLADARRVLAEQVRTFVEARASWDVERVKALAELDTAHEEHVLRDRELGRREVELAEAEAELAAEHESLSRLAARLEAERLRAGAEAAALQAQADRRFDDAAALERTVAHRTTGLAELYQTWGRRRAQELRKLRRSQEANAVEREGWAALRENWLRARARLFSEQQELAARQLAVEKYRQEHVDAADRPAVAERRLERLRRKWLGYCARQSAELNRLAATLGEESGQLDMRFAEVQAEERNVRQRSSDVNDLFADAERQLHSAAQTRIACHDQLAAATAHEAHLQRRIAHMDEQIDRLARLLIDLPRQGELKAA